MSASRREQLEEFVRKNPGEAFARYGLAMELMRSGDNDEALEQFRVLREQHPDYPAGFQQAGQLLIKLERSAEASAVLEKGIAAAERRGDSHAAAEMRGLLEESRS
ncbi:MAG: tetratricopeptide repeat protein [Terriglobales bacterium]